MKHAGKEAIARLEPLIRKIRRFGELRENRPGVFYLKSRAFLHFHENSKGFFADVKLDDDFSRFPSNTAKQQGVLLERIRRHLATR